MKDAARQKLDEEIARVEATQKMLTYLAGVVDDGPQHGGETHRADASAALLHGAQIARQHKRNLLSVGQRYDERIAGG